MTDPVFNLTNFYATLLGCDPDYLDRPQITVVPHIMQEKGFEALYLCKRGNSLVISVMSQSPAYAVDQAMRIVRGADASEVFNAEFWKKELGDGYQSVKGPSFIAYGTPLTLKEDQSEQEVVKLNPKRREPSAAIRRFFQQFEMDTWEASGLELDHEEMAGVFDEDQLVALGSVEPWTEKLGELHGIALPQVSDDSTLAGVLSTLARELVDREATPVLRGELADSRLVSLRDKLGLQEFAQTIVVRFDEIDSAT